MADTYVNLPPIAAISWKASVADQASLPTSGNSSGDARVTRDTSSVYIWSGSAWINPAGSGGTTTIGTYDSQSAAANGLVISGVNLYAQSADATHPGMVSTGTQTLAGAKTLTGNTLIANNAGSQATIGGSSSTAIHQLNGGLKRTVKTVITTYTVDTTTKDDILFLDSTGGAFNLTLSAHSAGRVITLIDSTGMLGTNNVTLVRAGAAGKIMGLSASYALVSSWGAWDIIDNGTDWFIKG